MKRTSFLKKNILRFGYEHQIVNNHFSGIKKHVNELSKQLDSMFPRDKSNREKS